MSPLVERALAVVDLCDEALWAELDAPFRHGADPAPETVRDEVLAASVLVARARAGLRSGSIKHMPPLHTRMGGMGGWICSHTPHLHDTETAQPFPPDFIHNLNVEARALIAALPPTATATTTPTPETNPL